MNNYTTVNNNHIPTTPTQADTPMPFCTGFPSLDPAYFEEESKAHKKHKKHKKRKKNKKKYLRRELQNSEEQRRQQAFIMGHIQHENEMLRRMFVLAVASSRRQLDENVIETAFKVLGE